MARFGLSFEDVHAVNPGAVYCSITGFGTGDGAALAGYDLLVQAVGGLDVDHGGARRRAGEGGRGARRRAHRPERVRRHPARPARARQYRPGAARRGEPRAEPALGADRTRRRPRSPPAPRPGGSATRTPASRPTRCSMQAIANSSSRSATTSSSGRSRACSGRISIRVLLRRALLDPGGSSITGVRRPAVRDERRPGRASRTSSPRSSSNASPGHPPATGSPRSRRSAFPPDS